MILDDYKQTAAWQTAIDLGLKLNVLSDDLPESELTGLSRQLRRQAVAVPTEIARDLVKGQKTASLGPLLHLEAVLELVRRTYPAIDTADIDSLVAELAERLTTDQFDAKKAVEVEKAAAEQPHEDDITAAPTLAEQPTETTAPAAPVNVAVQAESPEEGGKEEQP